MRMRDRTKKIFLNLKLNEEKDDVYNFDESDDDPYNTDGTVSEYQPSSSSESTNCSYVNNLDDHSCNTPEAESELTKTKLTPENLNFTSFSFEYDNDFNGESIFNETVITSIRDFLQRTSSCVEPDKEININREQRLEIYKSPYLRENKYKKTTCKFCEAQVVSRHFSRHLERHHSDERQVKELFNFKPGSREKKQLLQLLRNEGNLDNAIRGKIVPKKCNFGEEIIQKNFAICAHCKGFYRRLNLSRHVKKCFARNPDANKLGSRPLSDSLIFSAGTIKFGAFLDSCSAKKEIFSKMRPDQITTEAIQDVLVVHFGEDLLKKTKLKRKIYHISNKLRECGKFLLEMKKIQYCQGMISILRPENFDNCIAAVKSMSRFDPSTRSFGAASLALHFRTTLTALCDLASKLVLRKKIPLPNDNMENTLKDLERFKNLVDSQWATEIGSLALKDVNEKASTKPKVLPVTEDIIKLVNLVNKKAEEAYEKVNTSQDIEAFKILSETALVATVLHNRKRVGDVQYLEWKACEEQINRANPVIQTEFTAALTESEKILTQNYCKITTIGKGSRPVTILVPRNVKKYFSMICKFRRREWFSEDNIYFFTYPKSKFWIDGCSVIRKYAAMCGAKYPELLTSNRLRKHIATVTQLLSLKENEIDQLAKFMGHTSKTHQTFYKLPEDIYQVAKVSKILQIMEKGNAAQFQNKSLDEINIDMEEISLDALEEINNKETSPMLKSTNSNQEIFYDSPRPSTSAANESSLPLISCEKKAPSTRLRWSADQKIIMRKFFHGKIKSKTALRKEDCEVFIQRHKPMFGQVSWLKIKTFVYNESRIK